MAFVFRSQKQSPFDFKKQNPEPSKLSSLSNEQSQLNGTTYSVMPVNQALVSPSKIMKGLPSLMKKDRSIRSDNFKENDIFQEGKFQVIKANLKQTKKVTPNHFFTSKVPRNINKDSQKILDKSLTCSQFNTSSTNDELSILEQKKPFMTNYLSKNFPVNKNLASLQEKVKDFRKLQTETIQRNNKYQNLLINCSLQENSQIKRKSSPPHSFDKTSYNSVLQKMKACKEKNHDKIGYDQGEIYMKTVEIMNPLKKCQTQKKLAKLHKGNMQSSFYKESDSEDSDFSQEQEDGTPGPGSYDNTINLKKAKSFRSRKEKFAKIFVSPLERFKEQEIKFHEISYVNEENPRRPENMRKNHVFLSNTPKFLPIEKKSLFPEPGSYNPRESLQHDIVRNLLKNANIASFNSTLPRFKDEKTSMTPGPGEYNIDSLEKTKLEQIKNHLSSTYKSQVQRCLDYFKEDPPEERKEETCNLQGLMDKKHQNYVIHKRQQHFDSSEFFSPPPFFSGVERFRNPPQVNFSSASPSSLHSKSFAKEITNTQPFNSSQERKLNQKVGEGVGVGSYLIDKDKWNKKSYNIFFH